VFHLVQKRHVELYARIGHAGGHKARNMPAFDQLLERFVMVEEDLFERLVNAGHAAPRPGKLQVGVLAPLVVFAPAASLVRREPCKRASSSIALIKQFPIVPDVFQPG